jgi:hypothetical protein
MEVCAQLKKKFKKRYGLSDKDAKTEAFSKFMHALLGLYMYALFLYLTLWVRDNECPSWEFVTSLDFDWQFISGAKTFRWPLVSFCLVSLG